MAARTVLAAIADRRSCRVVNGLQDQLRSTLLEELPSSLPVVPYTLLKAYTLDQQRACPELHLTRTFLHLVDAA